MSARDRSIISLILLLVVAVGGYLLVVQPRQHEASRLRDQISSEKTVLDQAKAKVQADRAAESQYAAYVGQLKSIKVAVPSDEQIPELINELQSASTADRVSFQAVSTSASAAAAATTGTTTSSFPSQNFSLNFTGNYFGVANLLGALADFVRTDDTHFDATGRLLSISTLSLSPGGTGSSGSGDVTAAVTALDYDVPTSLLPVDPTGVSSASSTGTATPAAYVTH